MDHQYIHSGNNTTTMAQWRAKHVQAYI